MKENYNEERLKFLLKNKTVIFCFYEKKIDNMISCEPRNA